MKASYTNKPAEYTTPVCLVFRTLGDAKVSLESFLKMK